MNQFIRPRRAPITGVILCLLTATIVLLTNRCGTGTKSANTTIRISAVNPPADIITVGAQFIADEINKAGIDHMQAKVFHSGVLSGGKGEAEIEMCQQGSIEIHVTSTGYLANLVPRTSIVSLPFLFRDADQVVRLIKSKGPCFDSIISELNTKNLHVIAWWPRGFRQLTNSKLPVHNLEDMKGLKIRVMNNALFVDNLKVMQANPVPMAWGEVYNGLQLKTLDGQENAEDVIFSSKLFEAQRYMTIWDYSTDFEVVLVNLTWWRGLTEDARSKIQEIADASVVLEEQLLRKNTLELRKKIEKAGMEIYYLSDSEKEAFKEAVQPVWVKYQNVFGKSYMEAFLKELEIH